MATTQYSYADLHASRGPLIISIHVLFSTLATVAVALRIYTRTILIPGTHGLEDWLLTATWLTLILLLGCMVEEVRFGSGRHIYALSLQQIINNAKASYFSVLAYGTAIYLVKCTLIVQCLRIFAIHRPTRLCCWGALVFVSLYSLPMFLASLLACLPIYSFWDFNYKGPRYCINLPALWYTHSGLNVFSDLIILALPISAIRQLNLRSSHKIAAILLFAIGFLGSIISIIRAYEYYLLGSSLDGTWNNIQGVWSTIEVSVFIICACTTGLKPWFDLKFKPMVSKVSRLWSSSNSTKIEKSSITQRAPSWMQSIANRRDRRTPRDRAARLPPLRLGTMRIGTLQTRDSISEDETMALPPRTLTRNTFRSDETLTGGMEHQNAMPTTHTSHESNIDSERFTR